jgi:Trk K+ transport system NAD-binding subunit
MKFLPAQFVYLMQNRQTRRNLRLLRGFLLFLLVMVVAYSVAFHFIMAAEGQTHSWVTGFYWTLTVMSTLGFGDITFRSDLGRLFSMLVLLSGVVFLLIVLPFTFIQFFYAPWLDAQSARRAPREVPEGTRGHVLVTHYDAVAISLVQRLVDHGRHYWVLEPELKRALDLHDAGIRVLVGERDVLATYRAAHAADAALVVVTGDDYENTNITFTVRELTPRAPIVSVARAGDSVDILELAGSSHVLHLPVMLGRSLARRTLGGESRASVMGRFGELVIAEAPATGTPLVGMSLRDGRLRQATGLTVVGVWERGSFGIPGPDTVIGSSTVLVLAGSEEQLARFDELTVIYNRPDAPVLVLGGGRVGRAVARALREREVPVTIVEKDPERIRDGTNYVLGSAADLACLERAGIREAGAVVVTTNDDATNIYLTIYCRRLRPDVQIVSRSTLERNVSTLHRAGADFVMSYASMGANAVFNVLEKDDVVMLAEGLNVFRYPVPRALAGRTLAETGIREATGCSVVAVQAPAGTSINPPAGHLLPPGGELILVGTTDAERAFVRRFGT